MKVWRIEKYFKGKLDKIKYYQSEKAFEKNWKHHRNHCACFKDILDTSLIGYDQDDKVIKQYSTKKEN